MKKLLFSLLFTSLTLPTFSQWFPINQDTTYSNNCVFFLNKDTGYVVGEEYNLPGDGLILRTLNGGQTWDTTRISATPWLMCLSVPSASVAYTGGQDGAVYKTVDSGTTWGFISVVPGFNNDCGDFYFLNNDTGFALDFYGKVFKTTDGAVSWSQVYAPSTSNLQNYFPNTGKFHFLNDTLGFVANGNSGSVLKTIDGGSTWTNIHIGNTTAIINSIFMLNKDTGYVVGNKGIITKTTNGGISWQPVTQLTASNKDLLDITFFSNNVGYIVGGRDAYTGLPNDPYHRLIYRTNDGGATWTPDYNLCCNWMTSICAANDSIGYAVGWKGRVLKITNAGSTTSIYNYPSMESKLITFPNPFSKQTTLQTDIPLINATLRVYNCFGQTVAQIKNLSGQTITFNRDNLPSGLYFVRLTANNKIYADKIVIVDK